MNKAEKNEYKRDFIRNFDVIRHELKSMYIYGCYTDIIGESEKQNRTTQDHLKRIQMVFPIESENFERTVKAESRNSRKVLYGFAYDRYNVNKNYLINGYRLQNFSSNFIDAYFTTLLNISQNGKIKEKDINCLSNDNVDNKTIRNIIKEMIASGVIEGEKEYTYSRDIFSELSNDELQQLYYAVGFHSAKSLVSVPGQFLMDKIERYLKWERGVEFNPSQMFSLKYNFLARVFNDDIIFTMLNAMNKGCYVKAEERIERGYADKRKYNEIVFVPLYFISEFYYGREYVMAADINGNIYIHRCDYIRNVKLMQNSKIKDTDSLYKKAVEIMKKSWCASLKKNEDGTINTDTKTVKLIFDRSEKNIIDREKQLGTIVENEDTDKFELDITVYDYGEIKPWLRRHSDRICVSTANENLRAELLAEYKEALKNYGVN